MRDLTKAVEELAAQIHDLPDVEKLRLVDAILTDLDKPDPEMATQEGLPTGLEHYKSSYEEAMLDV
ncbi:MAG: hypothetical protein ACREQA_16435 [Candidatus Binatia bacterium]